MNVTYMPIYASLHVSNLHVSVYGAVPLLHREARRMHAEQ